MQALYHTLGEAAPSRATVFLVGESGTGKELAAEQLHARSRRRHRAFVPINCAAIPPELMESEIFGHVRGAFTGAINRREGAAMTADGGTLFLDEICEMPRSLQVKLLRFIQTGEVVPVGSSTAQKVDVRFVCATNKDPWAAVQNGSFREDLYFRLFVIPVTMPALRDRGGDVIDIASDAITRFAEEEGRSPPRFTKEARALLLDYPWPGNVRELLNLIHSMVVLNDGATITADMVALALATRLSDRTVLPVPADYMSQTETAAARPTTGPHHDRHSHSRPSDPAPPKGDTKDQVLTLAEAERRAIERALVAADGHVGRAAELLDIGPATLYRRLKDWGLHAKDFAPRGTGLGRAAMPARNPPYT